MGRCFERLSLVICLLGFGALAEPAQAQQDNRVVQVGIGDAVVTGFSGVQAPPPGTRPPAGKSLADITFINPDGPSARVVTLSRPGAVWDGRLIAAPKPFSAFAKDVGQVFGIALDDQTPPNIYLSATSQFGLNIVRRTSGAAFERMKKGGPGAGWMRGQFGLDLQGGPGAIYKIDGRTGAPTLFANVTLDGSPNPGPALGNLAFDAARKQLFVSDLYTGMIHRFDLDGRELDRFDHGVNGRPAQRLAPVAFNPANRPNIGNDRFDSEKPETWGYAVAPRQVWGLAVHQDRLYYSVASGPQIWSVGLQRDGSFANDARWELDVPAQAGPLPVSDIAFSEQGAMLLAQRALVAGAYDFNALTRPGEPQVFRVWLKGPNDPPSPSRWKLVPEEYAVGFAGTFRNTNGGVALGYGYGQDGALSANACEFALWTTGQNLRNSEALRPQLQPGGEMVVHGLAGMPASPVRTFNDPPWTSYFIDYDDGFGDPRAAGHLGSVRIYTRPCTPPAVYGGPGHRMNPPYTYPPTVVVVDPGCSGRDCSPPPGQAGELRVIKKVVYVGPILLPATTYPVTVTCGSSVTTLSLTENVPQTVGNIPFGTSCSVTEPPPPVPPGACPPNMGVWTTAIAPPSPITINAPRTDVTVTNTLECKPHDGGGTGYHRVNKIIENRTELSLNTLTALTFPMTSTCGSTTTPLNVQLTSPGIVSNIPVGTVCSVAETLPPPPTAGCGSGRTPTWGTPTYTPATVTIAAGAGPVITVKNVLTCEPSGGGQVGELIVKKEVRTAGFPLPGPYNVTVTCGSNVTAMPLMDGVPQSIGNLTYGTSCALVEAPPAVPPSNVCPAGSTPTWSPPAITPPSPIVIGAAVTHVTVNNTLTCIKAAVCTAPMVQNQSGECACPPPMVMVIGAINRCDCPRGTTLVDGKCVTVPPPPPVCVKPMVLNDKGECACPNGTVLRGRECIKIPVCTPPMTLNQAGVCACPPGTVRRGNRCVEPVTCRAPATLNKAGTACTCPRGMTLQGNTCVERERKGPSVEERVIRSIPGVLGPGGLGIGGGGREGGGGGRGGPAGGPGGGSPGGGSPGGGKI